MASHLDTKKEGDQRKNITLFGSGSVVIRRSQTQVHSPSLTTFVIGSTDFIPLTVMLVATQLVSLQQVGRLNPDLVRIKGKCIRYINMCNMFFFKFYI